ncbi:MAG: UDP-N-acetylmuramate dehydrogenase [Ruminococcaceae bacterium]|nr:UDP-N-acetylmuramate dehydrogenase [Oscillospiraceae bacterium]
MQTQLISRLHERADIKVIEHAPMCDYTSLQIGGPADLLVLPQTAEGLDFSLKTLRHAGLPVFVVGAGSNLLVSDAGVRGAVVRLGAPFSRVTREENVLTAEAGVTLARLAATALEAGLSGLEFASGIPGTLGGAVYMNAGAYGGEMKQIVLETDFLESDGTPGTLRGEAHAFSYRKSAFIKTGRVILRSRLMLTPADPADIRRTMQELNARRREKQPLSFPSAGSFFKRPEGHFAGALIEEAGLKGLTVGGAQISEKHAGFLINLGGATSEDVCRLMKQVQKRVHEHSGVSLEPEVQFLGDFSQASVL